MNQMPSQSQMPKRSAGPAVGIVIIVLVLIIGALYFWGSSLNKSEEPYPQTSTPTTESNPTVASTDSVQDISADLNATTVDGVDTDMNAVQQEMGP